jgi:hypothetical protein
MRLKLALLGLLLAAVAIRGSAAAKSCAPATAGDVTAYCDLNGRGHRVCDPGNPGAFVDCSLTEAQGGPRIRRCRAGKCAGRS